MSRTHLVTGGGSGIGAAVVRLLHERGDRLILVARDEQRAGDLRAQLPHAEVVALDLADPNALDVLDASSWMPERLDSVVHAAGVVTLGPAGEQPVAQLRHQLEVNLVAPAALTQAALPALRAARGTVLFVNSTSGITANPSWSGYAASKFALRGYADALRAEEAEHGVRVTSFYPSRTATRMQQEVHAQEGRDYRPEAWMSAETVAAQIVTTLDLPCDATLTDVTMRTAPGLG